MAFAAPLALAGTLAGAGIGAGSSILGGMSNANMYNYRAGVAKANQQIALQNANYQLTAGGTRALISGERTRFQVGRIASGQGASGLDVNRGSAPLVRQSQQLVGQQDQTTIRENASRAAYGENVKAAEYGAEASADESAASTSRTAGFIGAASSLVSGATGVASKWYQGTQSGLFGGSSGGFGPEEGLGA